MLDPERPDACGAPASASAARYRPNPETPPPSEAARALQRKILSAALLILLLAAFSFLGRRGLLEPDEGRYTAVALEMLRTGDWWHPALNHEQPHYTKPPITYWSVAASLATLGHSEFAVRLPNAIAFALAALAVGWMARRLAPGRAWLALLIYATCFLPSLAASILTTDTLLTGFGTAAMAAFVASWRRLDFEPTAGFRVGPLRVFWMLIGGAFLTKGPPGLLMLLPILVGVVRFDGWRVLRRFADPLGVAVGAGIGFSWFLGVVIGDPNLLDYFLRHELYGRVLTDEHRRNPEWYKAFLYVPVLLFGMAPWSWAWWSQRSLRWRHVKHEPVTFLLTSWVGLPLIVFLLAKSRLPLYVLPLAAPLALATARTFPREWLARPRNWIFVVAALVVTCGVRLAPIDRLLADDDPRQLSQRLRIPSGVDEIQFLETRPRYGLAFYSRIPVEGVVLSEGNGRETLAQELAGRMHRSLLLVMRASNVERAKRIVSEQRWQLEGARSVDDWVVLEIRALE